MYPLQYISKHSMRFKESSKFFGLIAAILICTGAIAQDIDRDFERLGKRYEAQAMQMSLEVYIYASYTKQTPSMSQMGRTVYDGERRFYQLGTYTLLDNPGFTLVKDDKKKVIIIQPRIEQSTMPNAQVRLDSLRNWAKNIKFDEKNGLGTYTFELDKGPFSKVSVVFHIGKGELVKFVHYYLPGAYHGIEGITELDAVRTEMVFKDQAFDIDSKALDKLLSEAQYLSVKNGRYVAREPYKTYKVFDFLNLN